MNYFPFLLIDDSLEHSKLVLVENGRAVTSLKLTLEVLNHAKEFTPTHLPLVNILSQEIENLKKSAYKCVFVPVYLLVYHVVCLVIIIR